MRMLERECLALKPPGSDDVSDTVDKLRALYSEAYGWDAPPIKTREGGAGIYGRMRYQVRRAINEWDLLRLRPSSRPETEVHEFIPSYEENKDLEIPTDVGDAG
jgi:hypothetical protein